MFYKLITPVLAIILLFPYTAWSDNNGATLAEYQPVLSDEFKQLLRNADLAAGEAYFMRKCNTCHDYEKTGSHQEGPLLWNILGKKAGSADNFEYSTAMQQSGHTWTLATLNYYLTRTDRAVPGLNMNFRGIKKDKLRANLIAYIRTLHDNPPPLS